LRRHGDALLIAARKHFSLQVENQPEEEARAVYLRWSKVEEAAGEKAQAAQLAEKGGDYVAASLLWEADEKYGEALRVLGRQAPRAEILARMAELSEHGGDFVRAGTLYEQAERTAEACQSYRAAGQYGDAARCLLRQLGDEGAAESEDYSNLMTKAGLAESAMALCLQVSRARGGASRAAGQLRRLLRPDPAVRISAALRTEAEVELRAAQQADRRRVLDFVQAGLGQARDEVLARYSPAWGMDLGTSKCAVAIFDVTRQEPVVCTYRGYPQFPSILALDTAGRELVGISTEDLLGPNIRAGITGSKRKMGTGTVYRAAGKTYQPEEVAARLLAHGRSIVEEFLREQIRSQIFDAARAKLGDVPQEWIEEASGAEHLIVSLPKAVIRQPTEKRFSTRFAPRPSSPAD
jgi:molecular chaperone DnaK